VVPAGYRITSPASGYYDVTVVGGQNATGKTFGNTKLALLSGNVFNDFNGNGVRDSGETALAGIKVYIDANKNGIFDIGEKSTTTNAAGNWSFALPAGAYRVREVPPAGYRISSPATGYFDITVLSGQTITGKTFADTNKVLISGVLFNDANGNGSKDTGETSLGGWTIYVDLNKDGKFDAGDVNTTTDVSGNWSFHGLSAGTYVIRVVTKIGWSQTRPAANGGQSVTLLSGQTKTGLLFSEKQSA
ncbi:MAG: Cna domain protein, partial [Phycisphaerales bacterium]|nr:Cna domain protein [Phycisphaerales bacterium]